MPNLNVPLRRRTWREILLVFLFPLMLVPLLAVAANVDEMNKLMQRGALKEALTLADGAIASKPQDANMRFLKGVVLVRLERKQDAMAVFVALTRDFPKMAEPYNNLGVLQAGFGDYEKARESLQRAVQLVPGYAVAHENLGDLYANLSTWAYEKATQFDGGNAKAKSKLVLARSLASAVTAGAAPQGPAILPATAATAAPATPGAAPAARPQDAPVIAMTADEKSVLDVLTRWAGAWSARDMATYLSAYAPDFKPASGISLAAWKAERTARIVGKKELLVEVQQPRLQIEGEQATVKFIQSYRSDRFTSTDVKTMVLVRKQGKWLIQHEEVTS
jgi:tetratricopeptide (TPR) repeat protein